MTSALELLPVAAGEFGRRVHALRPGDWTNPTPDTEWTVRDLVNHLVAEHLWAPPLLAGQGLHDVGDRFDGDVFGADPTAAWDAAIEASLRAWAAAADEDTVALSVGPPRAAAGADFTGPTPRPSAAQRGTTDSATSLVSRV